MDYRVERKYLCTAGQLAILEARMRALMAPDPHMPSPDGYRVRSLYFDDETDRFANENLDGVDDRVKYRLRMYNGDPGLVRLEIKRKTAGFTRKYECRLTRAEAETLIAGRCPQVTEASPQAMRRLYAEARTSLTRPRLTVEYTRTAYVARTGNVRVTFDRDIGYSERVGEFLTERARTTPLLPTGRHILEVKYDELIPDWILQALETGGLQQETFSKYVLSRLAAEGR